MVSATNGSVSFGDEADGRPQHDFLSAVKLATDGVILNILFCVKRSDFIKFSQVFYHEFISVEPLNSFNSARPREKEVTDSSEGLVAAGHLSGE